MVWISRMYPYTIVSPILSTSRSDVTPASTMGLSAQWLVTVHAGQRGENTILQWWWWVTGEMGAFMGREEGETKRRGVAVAMAHILSFAKPPHPFSFLKHTPPTQVVYVRGDCCFSPSDMWLTATVQQPLPITAVVDYRPAVRADKVVAVLDHTWLEWILEVVASTRSRFPRPGLIHPLLLNRSMPEK